MSNSSARWSWIVALGVALAPSPTPAHGQEGQRELESSYPLTFLDLNYVQEFGNYAEAERNLRDFLAALGKRCDPTSRVSYLLGPVKQ